MTRPIPPDVRAALAKPIADRFISRKPGQADADYVAHSIIRQLLLLLCDDHREVVLREHVFTDDKGRRSVACLVQLEVCIDGEWYGPWTEFGESENFKSPFKSAQSDAIKRLAAMHLGLGLHLWGRGQYFLDAKLANRAAEIEAIVPVDAEPAVDDGLNHDDLQAPPSSPPAGASGSPAAERAAARRDDEMAARRQAKAEAFGPPPEPEPAAPLNRSAINAWKGLMSHAGIRAEVEHAALEAVFGVTSIKDLDGDKARDLLKRLREGLTTEDGTRRPPEELQEAFAAKGVALLAERAGTAS